MSEAVKSTLISGAFNLAGALIGALIPAFLNRDKHQPKPRLARASWAVPEDLKDSYEKEVLSKRKKPDRPSFIIKHHQIIGILIGTFTGMLVFIVVALLKSPGLQLSTKLDVVVLLVSLLISFIGSWLTVRILSSTGK
jgi:hypothetical protein